MAEYIEREAALMAVMRAGCLANTVQILKDIPAADVVERKRGEWVSVEERLPEKHGKLYLCLLAFPNWWKPFPYVLNWHAYGDNGYVNGPHFSDEGLDGMKVTHWMEIPEPPNCGADMREDTE